MERVYTYLCDKEENSPPSSLYGYFFPSAFRLDMGKNEQVSEGLSADLTPVRLGHVTFIAGGGITTPPPGDII